MESVNFTLVNLPHFGYSFGCMNDATDHLIRLDKALVARGLVSSRTRAQALITKGGVAMNGKMVTERDRLVVDSDEITLLFSDVEWVSRAGLKLEHALRYWNIDVEGKTVLDIGASTGGFTDVLLAGGAAKVYALDVGHEQLAEKLRADPRVVNMEGRHIKDVLPEDFSSPIEMIVIDTSFISIAKVLPVLPRLIRKSGILVGLIKPQFEVGRAHINKGIVKDPVLRARAVEEALIALAHHGFSVRGVIDSPILGGDGNKEFLFSAILVDR